MIKGKKCAGKGGRKVVGWYTKELEEKVSNLMVKDTEEMVSCRCMSQEEVDECWMRIAGKPRRRFGTSTRWRTAKEMLAKEDVCLWSGDWYEEAGNTGFANGDCRARIFTWFCSESKTCRTKDKSRRKEEWMQTQQLVG